VLRGGSWLNDARSLRSASRGASSPGNRNVIFGLRLAGGFDPQASGSPLALTAERLAQQKPSRGQSERGEVEVPKISILNKVKDYFSL